MKRQMCRKSASILPLFYLKAGYKFSPYWRQTLISPEMAPEESTSKAHPVIHHLLPYVYLPRSGSLGRLSSVLSSFHTWTALVKMLYEPELQATTELLVMRFLPQHVQYTVSFFVTLSPLPMQGVWEVTGKTQGLVCGPCLLIFH